ncbi:restriction endonuclease [Streptomyces sp. B8F3]|uniref:restriction endonuclease n=1 Tax=Streptomyces sp. B8F3 TaxID=3153573 RepID=UPI00325D8501
MQQDARKKTISPHAYNALASALTLVYWNKPEFRRYVTAMLGSHTELLARLDFTGTKRETSGQLVELLRANEARYLDLTVALMLDLADMDRFPNLEQQVDGAEMVTKAKAAVAELRLWTQKQRETILEQEAHGALIAERVKQAQRNQLFAADHDALQRRFMGMHNATDPHQRGRDFEGFINELFALYDLEPRASYSMDHEQIDGAFVFNTDHYVLEAKWWNVKVGRPLLDIFKVNIERKGKNTLGLYISVNGFTSDALDVNSYSTPFITMDGGDFMAVLERRIRLDDLIGHKKAHASQTGHCYLPVTEILARSD